MQKFWTFDRANSVFVALCGAIAVGFVIWDHLPQNKTPVAAMQPTSLFSWWPWILIALCTAIFISQWVRWIFSHPSQKIASKVDAIHPFDVPLKRILNQHYARETVSLDGKDFIDCTFENVSFEYEGTTGSRLTNCKVAAPFSLRSNTNHGVQQAIVLMSEFAKAIGHDIGGVTIRDKSEAR